MKTLGNLSKSIDVWSSKIGKKLIEAQKDSAEQVRKDAVSYAPVDTGTYVSSIQVGDTEIEGNTIKTKIFTRLKAGWKKHPEVTLGAWLEWGVGLSGEASNDYNHGYSYTYKTWWIPGHENEPFIGMIARPHFLPSLLKNRNYYLEQIRKAVKNR